MVILGGASRRDAEKFRKGITSEIERAWNAVKQQAPFLSEDLGKVKPRKSKA